MVRRGPETNLEKIKIIDQMIEHYSEQKFNKCHEYCDQDGHTKKYFWEVHANV